MIPLNLLLYCRYYSFHLNDLEGIAVDKHPGALRRDWTSLYPGQRTKQGVDLTNYLLLCSLIPSNITFQRWWGLQGRCTPALPTAIIGRLSQPGLRESRLNFSDRVIETSLLVYCVATYLFCLPPWEQKRTSNKGGSKRKQKKAGVWLDMLKIFDQRDATQNSDSWVLRKMLLVIFIHLRSFQNELTVS